MNRFYRTATDVLIRTEVIPALEAMGEAYLATSKGKPRDEKGKKTGEKEMIFPRYHQLDAVRRLLKEGDVRYIALSWGSKEPPLSHRLPLEDIILCAP